MEQFYPSTLMNNTRIFTELTSLMQRAPVLRNTALTDETRLPAKIRISELQAVCARLALVASAKTIERILELLDSPTATFDNLTEQLTDLRSRLEDELKGRLFFYVQDATHYIKPLEGFEKVIECFKSTEFDIAFDIEEAAKCLALRRSTACVFHLMRVLEVGLYKLADHLQIHNLQENWQNAIDQIASAIDDINKRGPGKNATEQAKDEWKNRKQLYSDIATHFIYIKEAWRNRTAHAGHTYTEEKAKQIFDNVRDFMCELVNIIG